MVIPAIPKLPVEVVSQPAPGRVRLKGIFRKTGATSQAQLVAMVARLPSPTI